jgi:mediator of RNA polymerase II transcription subunit 14
VTNTWIWPSCSYERRTEHSLYWAWVDGGYGGCWVPLAALKKVLRGILWLFAQLPELLKEILGSILKDNEGSLLNFDQEQPALRFYVG